jgi:hypothetical protein
VDYLSKFEAILEKALTCASVAQGKLFDEKNRSLKSPFKSAATGKPIVISFADTGHSTPLCHTYRFESDKMLIHEHQLDTV